MNNDILTIKHVADDLRCKESNVHYFIRKGDLTAHKLSGKCWIVRRSDLERFKIDRLK
jgi:excisionase family DNA binding protein